MIRDKNKDSYRELCNLLVEKKLMKKKDAEAFCYALQEIDEAVLKVRTKIVPDILNKADSNLDVLQDAVWDVREEFRHIQYHIDDGKLTE